MRNVDESYFMLVMDSESVRNVGESYPVFMNNEPMRNVGESYPAFMVNNEPVRNVGESCPVFTTDNEFVWVKRTLPSVDSGW